MARGDVAHALATRLAAIGDGKITPISFRVSNRPKRSGLGSTLVTVTADPGVIGAAARWGRRRTRDRPAHAAPGVPGRGLAAAQGNHPAIRAILHQHLEAEGPQHPLGMVAGENRLDDPSLTLRAQPGQEDRGFHLRRGFGQAVADRSEPAAAQAERQTVALSADPGSAHEPKGLAPGPWGDRAATRRR